MQLDIDDITYFVNSLNEEEFKLLLKIANEKTKEEKEKTKILEKK